MEPGPGWGRRRMVWAVDKMWPSPAPQREESVSPLPKKGKPPCPQPQQQPEGECLLVPPTPAEEECLLVLPQPQGKVCQLHVLDAQACTSRGRVLACPTTITGGDQLGGLPPHCRDILLLPYLRGAGTFPVQLSPSHQRKACYQQRKNACWSYHNHRGKSASSMSLTVGA
ncbi:UNVERIFIED_CONTAM: hypothetical protein FKN15_066049 [Acipenser sinensis]